MRQSLEFLDLDDKDVAADDATTFLQWQHRLQYARPVKKGFFSWEKFPRVPYSVKYHSRRLGCVAPPPSPIVQMLDLETGEMSTWTDEESSTILSEFFLSDRYLIISWSDGYEPSKCVCVLVAEARLTGSAAG